MPYRVFILGLLLMVLSGCSEHQSIGPLKVGTNQWPGYEPLYLAQQLGFHNKKQIKLVELTSSTDVLNAFNQHQLDVAALTLDETLRALEADPNLVIILVTDISDGADAVFARPDIQHISELKGKKVGVEQTALGAYFLSLILKQAELTKQQITIIPSTVDSHLQMMEQQKLDAVVTFEPVASNLKSAGFRQIFDSSQTPGKIVDVLVTRNDVVESHSRAIQLLIDAHWKTLRFLDAEPALAAQKIAPRLNISVDETLNAYEGMDLPDKKGNRILLNGRLKQTADELQTVMIHEGLLKQELDLSQLFSDEFIQ